MSAKRGLGSQWLRGFPLQGQESLLIQHVNDSSKQIIVIESEHISPRIILDWSQHLVVHKAFDISRNLDCMFAREKVFDVSSHDAVLLYCTRQDLQLDLSDELELEGNCQCRQEIAGFQKVICEQSVDFFYFGLQSP